MSMKDLKRVREIYEHFIESPLYDLKKIEKNIIDTRINLVHAISENQKRIILKRFSELSGCDCRYAAPEASYSMINFYLSKDHKIAAFEQSAFDNFTIKDRFDANSDVLLTILNNKSEFTKVQRRYVEYRKRISIMESSFSKKNTATIEAIKAKLSTRFRDMLTTVYNEFGRIMISSEEKEHITSTMREKYGDFVPFEHIKGLDKGRFISLQRFKKGEDRWSAEPKSINRQDLNKILLENTETLRQLEKEYNMCMFKKNLSKNQNGLQ